MAQSNFTLHGTSGQDFLARQIEEAKVYITSN
jgi:hypothetical protein